MKVRIKDLKPNPYRDMKNYPIDNGKVQSLTNSIEQTGFWDNILARKNNGDIQIAYGHHRLIVLQKLFKPDDIVDIPVKELDDSMMIRIMANENDESWGTSPKIIDETVRVTKKFLEERPEIVANLCAMAQRLRSKNYPIGAEIISEFLNGNWSESRIRYSLERIGLSETEETHETHIDKEAVEMYPTERSARNFVKAIKQIKNITPEQQRNVAKRMVEKESFGESIVKSELLEEKYSNKKTEKDKEEKNYIEFIDILKECINYLNKLNDSLEKLSIYKEKFDFNIRRYEDNISVVEFINKLEIMEGWLDQIKGKEVKKHEKEIGLLETVN